MKKPGRKRKTSQYKFRRQTFPFHQYWLMYFTEKYIDGVEKDFASFIKAKSYNTAKTILKLKCREDNKEVKLKGVSGFMLHKDYTNTVTQKKLTIEDWSNVKKSAFPNLNNFLFKKFNPRPEGYTNRFNKCTSEDVKNKGFKKGDDNWSRKNRKGVSKKISERKGLVWNGGAWVKWDKEEMKKVKNQIVEALIIYKHSRSKAAKHLEMGRGTLYKLMSRCADKSWWDKRFPIVKSLPPRVPREQRYATQKRVMAERRAKGIKPFGKLEDVEEKRLANLRASKAKERDEYRKSLIPKIEKALSENNNVRTLAAQSLNVKYGTLKAWMKRTSCWVNWSEKYPSRYNNKSGITWNTVNK